MSPATIQLLSMILGAIVDLVPKVEADRALIQQWVGFCKTIVDENRDPTDAEMAAARAFAESEHNQIQGAV